jgi:hypothetical protein
LTSEANFKMTLFFLILVPSESYMTILHTGRFRRLPKQTDGGNYEAQIPLVHLAYGPSRKSVNALHKNLAFIWAFGPQAAGVWHVDCKGT